MAVMTTVTVSAVLVAVSVPFFGPLSWWFAAFAGGALVMGAMYRAVGARVERLRRVDDGAGELADALTVIGKTQAPGVVRFLGDEFELVPIVGEPLTVQVAHIRILKTGRWLPGKWVWGKLAFNMMLANGERVGFAVGETTGGRWLGQLPSHLRPR